MIYIYTYILSGNTGPTRWVLCHFLGIGHLDPWRCVATCSTSETLPNGDRGMGRYRCEPSIGPLFSPWQPGFFTPNFCALSELRRAPRISRRSVHGCRFSAPGTTVAFGRAHLATAAEDGGIE